MSAVKRVAQAAETIRARWEQRVVSDPQTEAAQALEDAGQLLDPEAAAELVAFREARELAEAVAEYGAFPVPVGPQMPPFPPAPETFEEKLRQDVARLQGLLAEAVRDAHRARSERDLIRERVSEPFGCTHCGVEKRSHGRRYIGGQGMHAWERPSDAQVKSPEMEQLHDDLTGANLSLWEEERATERLRWALASARRGRSRLRAQVAALLTERRSTNEPLTVTAEALRARQSCSCPSADQPGPHQVGCPQAEVPGGGVEYAVQYPDGETVMTETVSRDRRRADASLRAHRELDPAMWRGCRVVQRSVTDGPWVDATPDAVTQVFAPVASLREVSSREEPHDSPLHQAHRIPHDLPVPDGCRLSVDELDEVSRRFIGGGS